ncbi:MAG: hypothetical protein K2Q06_04575, partial [Parvularculaceae bacterium]|nr:hypothetical protein [Parvularculaceae bacterium]
MLGPAVPNHVAGDKTCDIRYLANGGGGKTLVSCGVGDLIQIAGAAPNEMRPLPGEFSTARTGDVLYRETARVAVTTAVLGAPVAATVGAAGPVRFESGEELRIFAVADRKAYCRVDRAALDPAQMQALTRNRGPFVGNRVIDVSVKTAQLLGFHSSGLAP